MVFTNKIKLLGFYASKKQTMKPEENYPDDAIVLARLLRSSLCSLLHNPNVEYKFKRVIAWNAVFIFTDEFDTLFAYYTGTGIARITNVVYNRDFIKNVPIDYTSWFIPGEEIPDHVDADNTDEELHTEDEVNHKFPSNDEFDWDSINL